MRLRSFGRAVVIAGVVAAIVAPTANAGFWSWGPGWFSTPGNGSCVWYTSTGVCSGWNYWLDVYGQNYCDSGGSVHTGFQNNDRIRGIYLDPCQSQSLFPEFVGMGGYLKAGTVIISGGLQRHVYTDAHA